MAEFTILDAPETPAPVFAFRALKGVIFGSPNDDDERNKENRQSPKQVPTLRSKISALQAPPISPTKRRKTNQYASPAKSILRTPGVPTPRRQNANVTFKDVPPSLSPEMTRKGPTTRERLLEIEGKGAVVAKAREIKEALPAALLTKTANAPEVISKTQAVKRAEVAEQIHAIFDVEAYKLSTEKEMKKLVRYGQKMREYARKQDEENTKLRLVVEQVQKENEELRKRETVREGARRGKQSERQIEEEERREGDRARPSKNTTQESQDREHPKSTANRTNTIYTANTRHSVPITKSEAPPAKNRQSSPLKRKASTQLRPESSRARNSETPTPSFLARQDNVPAEEPAPAPVPGPGTARLPLDRVAAARERIRLKAELRKKNAAGTSSPVNCNGL